MGMKYDLLLEFREYLQAVCSNKNTADRYFFAVTKLFKGQQFNSLKEIDPEFIKNEMSRIKTKNNFSATKNGLKHLKTYDEDLRLPDNEFFAETCRRKRNWTSKPSKVLYLDNIKKKINTIKNKKMKYAYRLMLVSGLRVSEVSKLLKEDMQINGAVITVNVKHGKGGSNGEVVCIPDKYLADKLKIYMDGLGEDEKLFYTDSTMKRRAGEIGIECHDLRRIAAITYRKRQMKEIGNNFETANAETMCFLRHTRFSTTKRYLFNRKLKFKKNTKKEMNSENRKGE